MLVPTNPPGPCTVASNPGTCEESHAFTAMEDSIVDIELHACGTEQHWEIAQHV